MQKNVLTHIFNRTLNYTQSQLSITSKKANKLNVQYNMSTGISVLSVSTNVIKNKLNYWNKIMHPIIPYYAIKSFPDPKICSMFSHFDCASSSEIKQVLKLNKNPNNIIFANPSKRINDLNYASDNKVNLLTADSLEECQKIININPNNKIILRISISEIGNVNTVFSNKFGIDNDLLCFNIIDGIMSINPQSLYGFSFHAGSGQKEVFVYEKAINKILNYINYIYSKYTDNNIRIIDIGGGFTDNFGLLKLRKIIDKYVSKNNNFIWIAEPGRYFSENSSELFVPIISKKTKWNKTCYVIADSIYHSFSCKVYDSITPVEYPTNDLVSFYKKQIHNFDKLEECHIFGDTCDGIDIIYSGLFPNNLNVNDILIFPNFGAYTYASSSKFNGFEPPMLHYENY